ncbi:MAG: hypothetical protein FJ098_05875 [Deltaproteobacteria bacterium]|nr:hypothetical protein [Deltaproteobacteria bacterium]
MAWGLQKGLAVRTGALLASLSVALWQVPGCLIPPEMEDSRENLPPEIDWGLSQPQGFEHTVDRSSDPSVEFSIANAVEDPEGDPLSYVWYHEVPGSVLGPVPMVGNKTMVLYPCEIFSLRTASRVDVAVWVSDELLEFSKDVTPFPVVSSSPTPEARFWTVVLLGECP